MGRVGDVLEGLDANCENNPSEVDTVVALYETPHFEVACGARFTAVDGLAGTDLAKGTYGKFKRHFEEFVSTYTIHTYLCIFMEGLQHL